MPQITIPNETDAIDQLERETPVYLRATQDVARQRAFGREEASGTVAAVQPPPLPPQQAEVPAPAGQSTDILSKPDWAAMNHPKLARQKFLSPGMLKRLREDYDQYVSLQLSVRDLNIRQQNADSLQGQRERTIAGRRGTAGGGSNIPGGIPPEVLKRAAADMQAGNYDSPDVKFLMRVQGRDPNKGRPTAIEKAQLEALPELMQRGPGGPKHRALQALQTKPSTLSEQFGPETIGTKISAAREIMAKQGVAGFLKVMQIFGPLLDSANPVEKSNLRKTFQRLAPTPQALIQAANDGEITPQQKKTMESVIFQLMSPEQQRQVALQIVARQRAESTQAQTSIGSPTDELARLRVKRKSIKRFQAEAPERKRQATKLKQKQEALADKVAFERAAVKNLEAKGSDRLTITDAKTGKVVSMHRTWPMDRHSYTKRQMTTALIHRLLDQGLRVPGLDDQAMETRKEKPVDRTPPPGALK